MNLEDRFYLLTGFAPYPWQLSLCAKLISGKLPARLHLPTAAGKTSVIPIWLCALWHQLESGLPLSLPRRLYFAVDRRVVVDQSEVLAQAICDNIEETALWKLMQQKTLSENPLVISVLRGQRVVEYDAIVSDPSAFAIVLCTPDMVFSRLLGGAYACGPRQASREMGLVGQDSFVVLDEAHISEANIKVLEFVSKHNHSLKPFWWTTMSATLRQDADFTLGPDDLTLMAAKLNAPKTLEVVAGDLIPTILKTIESHAEPWSRLIVYVEKPADAIRLYRKLGNHHCILLTGTMRGYERTNLDFTPFKTATPEGKHVLIATSAGEVGLDISCEFLITEIAAAERLAQRFGRCNRWNECKQAHVYVVNTQKKKEGEEPSGKQAAIAATVAYLKVLDGDISTRHLYHHPIPAEAFSPVSPSLSLNKASLRQITNTTYPSLDVSDYIRGVEVEYHVNLVIRKEAELKVLIALLKSDHDDDELDEIRVANNEIFKELPQNLVKRMESVHGSEYLCITSSGTVKFIDKLMADELKGATLFLPESANLINPHGLFEIGGGGEGDVFAKVQVNTLRFIQTDAGFLNLASNEVVAVDSVEKLTKTIPVDAGSKAKVTFYENGLVYVRIQNKLKTSKLTVDAHLDRAIVHAEKLSLALSLDPVVMSNVVSAAEKHDDGKLHDLWQLAARGTTRGVPLAKVGYFKNPALLNGMRHELVSALWNPKLGSLAKWLVVSHHGRCRPMFDASAYDPEGIAESAALNSELPRMLSDLSQEYGTWGLAYLECLMRAVDINAE